MAFDKIRDSESSITYEVLKPLHEIDSYNGEDMRLYIKGVIDRVDAFLIDFLQVAYVNSSGLRELIQILTTIREKGRKMAFINVPGDVYKIFVHTNLDRLFTFHKSVQEALESFEKS